MNKGPRHSILLIEDEPLLAMDVEMVLTEAGFRVIGPATTTAQAMRLIRDQQPELTLLDLNLGNEMVFPVADLLAETGRPFVILSGHSRQMVPPRHRDPCRRRPRGRSPRLRSCAVRCPARCRR